MANSNMTYHTIQPGDTLWDLAEMYGTTAEEIEEANPGIEPDNLQIGQVIVIPETPWAAEEQWPPRPWGPPQRWGPPRPWGPPQRWGPPRPWGSRPPCPWGGPPPPPPPY
jgi:LysM repeat protein